MIRLTNGQRAALDALCRTIAPTAFERAETSDLPLHVEQRIAELTPFHRQRALLALTLFAGRTLSLLIAASATPFTGLSPEARTRFLARCSTHARSHIRLLFNSVRRLVLHTHYGRPEARNEIGHAGPLHEREVLYAWEGELADAQPVVAATHRDVIRERAVPDGVVEGKAITSDRQIDTRVCIIGSGVGGGTAAAILAAAGLDVVVLEAGGYYTAADFSDDETVALRTLYADNGLRSTDELNVSILQGRCAGGGSTVNWMVMLRTPQNVIEEWQQEHGTEYMDVRSMTAAFEQFEDANHVGRVAAHAHSPINRLILDGSAKLGWRAEGASVNARECMRTGLCGLGCRYDAKQSTLLMQLSRALQMGTQLFCDVDTRRIERRGKRFRVHGVVNGRSLTVDCDVVIAAAGAVGTPTLLQRSGLAPKGAGSHLRLHPTTGVMGLYDEPFYAATGIPLTSYCDEFLHMNGGYGHWIEAPPLTAGLCAVAIPGFGDEHHALMRRFPYIAPLIVLLRDGAPGGASVGSVRARGNDARIRFSLGSTDRATMLHGIESAARIHFSAGARAVITLHGHTTLLKSESDLPLIAESNRRYGDPALFSAHVNGTCRIGRDARTSGCRPDGQVHGQPNVYVMDGSLLPTAPGVNPHETIAATVSILATNLATALSHSG